MEVDIYRCNTSLSSVQNGIPAPSWYESLYTFVAEYIASKSPSDNAPLHFGPTHVKWIEPRSRAGPFINPTYPTLLTKNGIFVRNKPAPGAIKHDKPPSLMDGAYVVYRTGIRVVKSDLVVGRAVALCVGVFCVVGLFASFSRSRHVS